MEETSDDLRSETSESDYNSGLLTDSVSTVIHISSYEKNNSKGKLQKIWLRYSDSQNYVYSDEFFLSPPLLQ